MRKFFLFLTLIIIIAACTKPVESGTTPPVVTPPVPPTTPADTVLKGDNLLSDKSVLIDSSAIISVKDEEVVLISAALKKEIKKDDVIIAAPNAVHNYGFLRKVVSSETQGGQTKIQTVPASLNEAFKTLNINQEFKTSHIIVGKAALRESGATLNDDGISVAISFENDNALGNGIALNGTLQLNIPSVKIEIEKKADTFAPKRVLIRADLNTNGSTLEITNSNSTLLDIPEKTLKKIPLPPLTLLIPVPTPVGIFPVPVKLSQEITLNALPLHIEGKFRFNLNPTFHSTLGVLYENGQWENISTKTIQAKNLTDFCMEDFQTGTEINTDLTIFNPRYSIKPYNLDNLEGFFEIPNKIKFKVGTTNPNYQLKYNLDVKGGVKTRFWDGSTKEFSITSSIVDKTIAQGNFVFCAECESFDLTAWWRGLDVSIQKVFNELIGVQGTQVPDSSGFQKLFDRPSLNLSEKNMKGDLVIPPCFNRTYQIILDRNQLTSLTVSHLPVLEVLFVEGNGLKTLEVSELPLLRWLDCHRNKLTKLDITKCPNVEILYCGENELSRLEIGNAKKLRNLRCADNQLEKLDVSACASLTSIFTPSNKLKILQLGSHPLLNSLNCSENELTTLDLGGCLNLTSLEYGRNKLGLLNDLTPFKDLVRLVCVENQMERLKISNNIKLKEVYCDNNQINFLQAGILPELERLSCKSNLIDSLDATIFPKVAYLYLTNNRLKNLKVAGLQQLRWVEFTNNSITRFDASNLPAIQWIYCDANPLGYDGVMQIIRSVGKDVTVSFSCEGNNIQRFNGPDPSHPQANSDCYTIRNYYDNR